MPLNCCPAPPKFARLRMLNAETFGSILNRSPTWKGQLRCRSTVFSQVGVAPGSAEPRHHRAQRSQLLPK